MATISRQVIIGIGEAIYSPAYDAIYSHSLDKGNYGKEWAAWEALNYLTLTVGAVVGSAIANYLGFSYLFAAMALLTFSAAIFIFSLPRKAL